MTKNLAKLIPLAIIGVIVVNLIQLPIHELGHYLAALAFGIKGTIHLGWFTSVSYFQWTPQSQFSDIVVRLAGSFLIFSIYLTIIIVAAIKHWWSKEPQLGLILYAIINMSYGISEVLLPGQLTPLQTWGL